MLQGMRVLLANAGIPASRLDSTVHGTTLITTKATVPWAFPIFRLIQTNKNALTPPSLSSTLDVHGQGEGCADIGIETHQ